MTEPNLDMLVQKAREMLQFSYSPYSRFAVGAAVLTTNGKVFSGTNVENASYGLTNCAERVAIQTAVAGGEKEIAVIAVVANSDSPVMPCGACLQVLLEFRQSTQEGLNYQETRVVLENKKGTRQVFLLSQLLPFPFALE